MDSMYFVKGKIMVKIYIKFIVNFNIDFNFLLTDYLFNVILFLSKMAKQTSNYM